MLLRGRVTPVKNRGCSMAVKHYGEVFQCKICGNKVEVIEVGGGTLVCCGKEMKSIEDKPEATVNLPDSGGE
jgi:desulfoferrodoxin-like iron-binding protein